MTVKNIKEATLPLFKMLLTGTGSIGVILSLNLLLNPLQMDMQYITGIICMVTSIFSLYFGVHLNIEKNQ